MTAEIIAKRREHSVWTDIFIVLFAGVFFALFIAITVLYSLDNNYAVSVISIIFAAIFLFIIVNVICEYIIYRKTPEILITYEDGKFYFANGFSCLTDEITEVHFKHSLNRYFVKGSWGKLIVKTDKKQIKLNYVENLDKVVFRLRERIKTNGSELIEQQGNNNG